MNTRCLILQRYEKGKMSEKKHKRRKSFAGLLQPKLYDIRVHRKINISQFRNYLVKLRIGLSKLIALQLFGDKITES